MSLNPGAIDWLKIIRIRHLCENGIEQCVLRITIWHQEVCRVMTNSDPEGQNFLSYPHKNNVFLSYSPLNTSFYIGKIKKTSTKS